MSQKELSRTLAQQALDAYAQTGTESKAADLLNLSRPTLQHRLKRAKHFGLKPSPGVENTEDSTVLKRRMKDSERYIRQLEEEKLHEEQIRQHIFGLANDVTKTPPPPWTVNPGPPSSPGVPLIFLSDLHWGEAVDPAQINGVNRYNIKIAQRRLQVLAESAITLLKIISPGLDYPGVVIPLGGDMISGNIHEELTATNEFNSMESILDLFGALIWLITFFADHFGKVFLPCVTGNHGRDTQKIWHKDRHKTSFDWLLYCMLAKHFEHDKRVTFLIPDGPDASFKIYHYRYLLTHGDQFRGGDGMIGALGPIIRGDHKKRSRNAQIDLEYDTMIMGHWHQYIHLTRVVVNGSLKGYDEYAYNNNFGFEEPQQAMWITHPKYGITFRSPVFVNRSDVAPKKLEWVSILK